MAERRMFSKNVIESDPFMDMPAEAQMLYIHLNMASDDDGFCDNPRAVIRSCGANNDSMKLLIAKKFILSFDKNDGFVVVIKHWRINNYIRKDNYRETKYKEFMKELYYDENRSYSMNPGDGHKPCIQTVDESYTNRIQTVDESLTQDRIGKNSIDKNRLEIGKDSIEKGEYEGGTEPPAAAMYSDPEKRIQRIDYFIERIKFFEQNNLGSGSGLYALAAGEGISKAEIELRRLQLEKQAAK